MADSIGSSTAAVPIGLTSHNCNYLKCWFTLIQDGKEVLQHIFEWGFGKPPNEIKKALFELPNYSNSRYRSDFNAVQRSKIELGDLSEFDINILYLLLQRICSLSTSHKDLDKESTSNSLPTLLYHIKMKRNTLAHTNLEITDIEMLKLIDELKSIFNKALDVAASKYCVPENILNEVKEKINLHIFSLQSSNFSLNEETIRAIANEKVVLALSEAQADLIATYKPFSEVMLAPWTAAQSFKNVKDVFTEPLLKQTKNEVLFQQMTQEDSIIKIKNILISRLPDSSIPNLILVLSPSGMGKTTLVKYLIQSWLERDGFIKTLDSFDLVLYMDCRITRAKSFDEILSSLLPNTAKLFDKRELKVLITTMQVLVVLDNIDEITEEALPTFEELLRLNSDTFRILATSTQHLPRTMSKKYHQKHLKLQLEGISRANFTSWLSKMYTSLYGPETAGSREGVVETFVSEYISKARLSSNESIGSPEILSHVFFHWLMQSKETVSYATKTQLFVTSHELLCLKLIEKFGQKSQTNILEQKIFLDKLNVFFDEFFRIAFQTFKANKLENSAFGELLEICTRLGLPHAIIKEILIIRERNLAFPSKNNELVTFPSHSLHTFYCAMHIVNMLTTEKDFSLNMVEDTIFQTAVKRNMFLLLMKFIIGILALNNIVKLETNLSYIFGHVIKYCEKCGSGIWLEMCEDARCHSLVMAEAQKYMGDSWFVEDQEIGASLITMLQNYPPNQITLTVCNPLDDIFFLKKALQICSNISNLSMSLHLYYHFWVDKTNFSDNYLEVLLKNLTTICLESFAGKLSSEFLLKLPPSLKRLALHIKPEDINILNAALTKLKDLFLLHLNLDITFDFPAKRLPRIKLPSSNILLNTDVWNVDEEHIDWTCDYVSSFSPAFCRLCLRKSSLDYHSTRRFLEGLRLRRVHVDTFVIGTTKIFSEEEEKQVLELANSFECSEVKFIYK